MSDNKASVGRIVLFVMPEPGNIPGMRDHAEGEVRPAIVVRTWGENGGPSSSVNLMILPDGTNDMQRDCKTRDEFTNGPIWKTSVCYDEAKRKGTWHWPQRT